MSEWQALILGILQGITEFLPISSSGHLVLGEEFLGLDTETLKSFDVALHVASLLAIVVYFWKDIWDMLKAVGRLVTGRLKRGDQDFWLIVFIAVGTVPAVIAGLTLEDWIDGNFRNVLAVGIVMMLVGLMFIVAEKVYGARKKSGMTVWKALVIGCFQAVALIPGVSRSGSTIVAGILQGIERERAARFSFLLGIPAIAGAGLFTVLKAPAGELLGSGAGPVVVGFVSSFVFGLLAVWFLMRFLKKHSLLVFAVYLLLLGGSIGFEHLLDKI